MTKCVGKCSDHKVTYLRNKMIFLQNTVFQNKSTYILEICRISLKQEVSKAQISSVSYIQKEWVYLTEQNKNTALQKCSNSVLQKLQSATWTSINKVRGQGYLRYFVDYKSVLH